MKVHPNGKRDGLSGSAAGGNRRIYIPTRKKTFPEGLVGVILSFHLPVRLILVAFRAFLRPLAQKLMKA